MSESQVSISSEFQVSSTAGQINCHPINSSLDDHILEEDKVINITLKGIASGENSSAFTAVTVRDNDKVQVGFRKDGLQLDNHFSTYCIEMKSEIGKRIKVQVNIKEPFESGKLKQCLFE